MAKRHHRLLSALLAAMLLSGSMVTANAATVGADESGAGSLSKYYSTNATGVGKEAKITIDGDASDWNESMKIAQGAAWDVANHWKGGHENCVLDTYALYGAWDDSNLYIGWQMVNTTDTWAREGDGPLSDGGRVLDVPLIVALSTNPNNTGMTGRVKDGKGIWGVDIEFQTHVDTLLYMSGKPGLGTPGFFKAADSTGVVDYLDTNSCQTFKDTGVEYKMATTNINSEIWGLNGSEDPMDVCDNNADWVDFKTLKHDTKYDSFYEVKIPFAALGITKDQLTKNGIGAMVVASRGESGLDCVPFDLCMLDNATGEYSSDPSTSAEKDDKDIITASLASIGNGTITPAPITTDSEKKTTDSEKKPVDTSSEKPAETDSQKDSGDGVTTVTATAKKGNTVTATLSISNVKKIMGISNTFTYDSSKYELVEAKGVYDGVEVNSTKPGEVKWNASFGDGKSGKDIASETALVQMKFKALSDASGELGKNTVRDCYDYDFKSLSTDCISAKASVGGASSDTDVKSDDIKVSAKASKGDTIKVTFTGDLSKIEGVSSVFNYDPSAVEYVGFASPNNGTQVEANQTTGMVRWNCVNANGASGSDIITFEFKTLKDVNGVIGTNSVKEIYDSNSKDLDPSALKANVSVGGKNDTDTVKDVEEDSSKINVTAKKGDRVVVTFKAKGLKNAAGIQEVVDFNTAALKYNADAASSLGIIKSEVSSGKIAWNVLFDLDKNGNGKDLTKESEVAVMTFTAQKDIKAADDVLFYAVKDFYDVDGNSFDAKNASAEAKVAGRGEGKVDVTAKEGNVVKVYCKAIDAAKALGMVEELTYDSKALGYVGYGKEMGTFRADPSISGTVRFATMFDAKGTDLVNETDVVVFTFKALKDIASTENVLSYVVDEFYDVNTKDFDVSTTTMTYASAFEEDLDPPTNTDGVKRDPDTEDDVKTSDTDDKKGSEDNKDTDSEDITVNPGDDGKKKMTITIIYGDVDDDKTVTSQDAVIILRRTNGMGELEETAEIAADVNDDKAVDSGDSLSVLRFSVNLNDESLVGKEVEITISFK